MGLTDSGTPQSAGTTGLSSAATHVFLASLAQITHFLWVSLPCVLAEVLAHSISYSSPVTTARL